MSEPVEKVFAGYVYAFYNPDMPALHKVGMTKYSPEKDRLSQANASDSWRPPSEYIVVHAKFVPNRLAAESELHTLLADRRKHPRR